MGGMSYIQCDGRLCDFRCYGGCLFLSVFIRFNLRASVLSIVFNLEI